MLQNGGILCPGQGCGNGLLIENNARRVTCHRASGGCGVGRIFFLTVAGKCGNVYFFVKACVCTFSLLTTFTSNTELKSFKF